MITFDGIIYNLQGVAGISKYFSSLVSQIERIRPGDLEVLVSNESLHRLPGDLLTYAKLVSMRPFERIRSVKLPENAKPGTGRVFHSSYYRLPADRSLPTVVTVHDMIHELLRDDLGSFVLREQKRRALEHASHIIVISQSTRDDLLKIYPHLSEKPITTIYNGASDVFSPSAGANNREDLIFVGSRQLYKDFGFALDAAAASRHRRLHIVGGGALTRSELAQIDACCPNRYQIYQNISDEQLNHLYGRCAALLYPSHYEGFGLPALESMRTGCIPIYRSKSSLPEVVGQAGFDIADRDAQALMDEFDALGQTDIHNLREKGFAQAQKFSWQTCAAQTNMIYEKLLT